MDKDTFTKDDVVGQGKLPINKFLNSNEQFKGISIDSLEYVQLHYKGKPAGKIFLCIKNGGQGSTWGNNQSVDWGNSGWNDNTNHNNNNNWGNNSNNNNNNNNNNSNWGNNNNNNQGNNGGWGQNNNGWGNSGNSGQPGTYKNN